MDIDDCHDESNQSKLPITNSSLDGDNPAFSRDTFMKSCTSRELVEETEKIFQEITNLTLDSKLACTGQISDET